MLEYLRGSGKHTKAIWWILIIVVVVTFLGGFVFIFGSGLSSGGRAQAVSAVATVDGTNITRTEYQNAITDQRTGYVARFGQEPGDRDMKTLEVQAFRALVLQRVMDQKAKELNLTAHDREVLLQLQSSPPPELMNNPSFRTNGQFDPQKYRAAMQDPNNDWSAFEERVRAQLPVRKLQERLFTSVKLTEPQLRQAYRDQNERVNGTLVAIVPDLSGNPATVSDADLQRAYDRYKSRFWTGPERQLEVLVVPKTYGPAEIKTAQDLANSLVQRLRAGENYVELSRQYSDAPGADQGGVVDRVLTPTDFGSELGPRVALMDTGQVTDAVRDGGRFLFFRINEKAVDPTRGLPGLRVSQFMVRVKPDEDAIRKQYEQLTKLRSQAQKDGLGRAAVAQALTTAKTDYFDLNSPPQQIAAVPEVADWAFSAKPNQVSPVIEGLDDFAIVQLIGTKEAGPMPKDAIAEPLRRIAQVEVALDRLKPRADSLTALIRAGRSLEEAAAAMHLDAQKLTGVTRLQSDPRLQGAPEVVGSLFGSQPGQVIGPIRGLSGYFAARLDQRIDPDWTAFEAQRQQISQQLLENMQRRFLEDYASTMRLTAKVKDLRSEISSY